MLNIRRFVLGTVLAISMAGCADVPEEAVLLSVTVTQDIEEMHRSHRELAARYFQRSRNDVDRFLDEVYRPLFIRAAFLEKTYVYEEGKPERPILSIIEAELEAGENGDPLFYMDVFVSEALAQIQSTRLEMIKPIEQREREVLRAIDDAYTKVQNAQAVVTGHLASVRRVHQVQDELLADAGLKDVRRNFIDKTAEISDRAAELLAKARTVQSKLPELEEAVGQVKALWQEKLN